MTISLTIHEIENTSSPTPKKYLYRVVPHNNSVIFTDEIAAFFNSKIHDAISESKTWGEFTERLPLGELDNIIQQMIELEYYIELGIDVDDIDGLPYDDDEVFNSDLVPGVLDGLYPEWLQPDMDYIMPKAFIEKFGVRKDTFLNGSYWELPPKQINEMIAFLESLGYEVESGEHLNFY